MTKSVTATPLALPQLLFMSDYALMQEQAHDWLRMRRNAVQLNSGLAAAGTPWTAFIADVSAFSSSATSKSPCAHSPCIECVRKGPAKQACTNAAVSTWNLHDAPARIRCCHASLS